MPLEHGRAPANSAGLPDRFSQYRFGLRITEQGQVVSIGDGIAWIKGLPSAAMDEMLNFEDGSRALVFHLEQELLGAILLEQSPALSSGVHAYRTGERLGIRVGDGLLGRVVDPLGSPLDGGGAAKMRSPP